MVRYSLMAEPISPSVLSDLAPAGKLRVGINYGNPVLATRDPASGDLRGVAVDLARELGKRGHATARGGKWSAGLVIAVRNRLGMGAAA